MSSENPNASSAGTQANLSIGGGPHIRMRVSSPGGGMCFPTICQAHGIEAVAISVVAMSGLRGIDQSVGGIHTATRRRGTTQGVAVINVQDVLLHVDP